MVHMDHIAREPEYEAVRAARYCLNIHDEKTDFFMAFPSNARESVADVDAVHRFDDAQPEVRWWTDSAPEFASAARTIPSTGLLAHTKTLQAAGQRPRGAQEPIVN